MASAAQQQALARTQQRKADSILNTLAANPQMRCTAPSLGVVRRIMLTTGGEMLACGDLYDIKSKSLGGGVYRITLERLAL